LIRELRDNRITRTRAVCIDFTGRAKAPYPAGDAEATVTLTGQFSRYCAFPAP
jgi:hypothetical protein